MPHLVTIDRRLSLPEAAVMASMLDAYRIPVATGGYCHASTHWFVLLAIGGVSLQVPDAVRETATALLKPVEPGRNLSESRRFWRRPVLHGLAALLVFAGLPLPIWLRSQRAGASEVGEET